jgi:hypothetical protein
MPTHFLSREIKLKIDPYRSNRPEKESSDRGLRLSLFFSDIVEQAARKPDEAQATSKNKDFTFMA